MIILFKIQIMKALRFMFSILNNNIENDKSKNKNTHF